VTNGASRNVVMINWSDPSHVTTNPALTCFEAKARAGVPDRFVRATNDFEDEADFGGREGSMDRRKLDGCRRIRSFYRA
jgi:hypothetical protein